MSKRSKRSQPAPLTDDRRVGETHEVDREDSGPPAPPELIEADHAEATIAHQNRAATQNEREHRGEPPKAKRSWADRPTRPKDDQARDAMWSRAFRRTMQTLRGHAGRLHLQRGWKPEQRPKSPRRRTRTAHGPPDDDSGGEPPPPVTARRREGGLRSHRSWST